MRFATIRWTALGYLENVGSQFLADRRSYPSGAKRKSHPAEGKSGHFATQVAARGFFSLLPIGHNAIEELVTCAAVMVVAGVAKLMRDDIFARGPSGTPSISDRLLALTHARRDHP